MPREYTEVCRMCPRSFLFAIVANVGPNGASRSLAVAYRQGNNYIKETYLERVDHFVADTLALIEILSDPANRAPLEAERALAEDWYCRSQGAAAVDCSERPSVPDSVQPPWVPWHERSERLQHRPQLHWRGNTVTKFPFTTTCLLLGLLDDSRDENAKATKKSRTRPGDVQLQPLSTAFRGDCIEYGLVVLDISDLDSGVQYGIAASPMRYMADVEYEDEPGDWDPVEDPPPQKEPDVVPFSPRPRVLLSIHQWLSKYFPYDHLKNDPSFLRLDDMPLVCTAVLDYIWPREIGLDQPEAGVPARASSRDAISNTIKVFWPTVSDHPPKDLFMDRAKDGSSTRSSTFTILNKPPQNVPEERSVLGREGDLEWLRGKSIYRTFAFPTSLRSRKFLPPPLSTISGAQVFPLVHMFRFMDHDYQGKDGPDVATDDVTQYENHYAIGNNTLLDAESFAVRFLAYLQSLGSGVLLLLLIIIIRSSSVSPIPAGLFEDQLPHDDPSRVSLGDLQSGSWGVLVDSSAHQTVAYDPLLDELPPPRALAHLEQIDHPSSDPTQLSRGGSPSLSDDDTVAGVNNGAFLHYSFVKIPNSSADIAPDQQQQQRPSLAIANSPGVVVVVVGGLTDFLRETAPGSDMAWTWEKQVQEAEEDHLRTRRAFLRIDTGVRSIDIGAMAEAGPALCLTDSYNPSRTEIVFLCFVLFFWGVTILTGVLT
ncbi:hypothetical protein HK57_00440 [Aspergillus ustus]|uniref:Uncharacterized protein n=1 Tax=Aspergillus ustus TaxID=40382 RepID=A0A0C1C3X2_ASPUT|nr:hypothetical protein HK57_00440 [Aspergillus ustus]